MTERITLLDKGMTLQIEYTMTDPKNWKGEWHSTKRWMRDGLQRHSGSRVPAESEREPAQHREGHAAVEAREKARRASR